jgi:methionyl-tRNA formyltransferase
MGTPGFAVESLKTLVQNQFDVVAVVTMPDKPAGRGHKLQMSPVKEYALEKNIPVLQPEKLKNPEFIDALKSYNADLQIVVAFRMLPEVVWDMPRLGTFNLHASLLPQYRGAAPINWAVIHGEIVTGATTFFLTHEIDTGKIILQEKVDILPDDDAGSVHDKLMELGGRLVVKTVRLIESGDCQALDQVELLKDVSELRPAPKLFRDNCEINWNQSTVQIHNFVRGLSPYPAAWCELKPEGVEEAIAYKIFKTKPETAIHDLLPGTILSDGKKYLKVASADGFVEITELQAPGKKRMLTGDYLRGLR